MSGLINGRNMVLYKYDENTEESIPFACATSSTLSIQTEAREKTNVSSAFFREYTPDVISWTISCSGLMTLSTEFNYLSILGLVTNRTSFIVKFVVDNGGVDGLSIFTGQVFISSLGIDGADDTIGTYSMELQGSGAYSLAGTIVTPGGVIIIQNTTVQVFQTTAAEGQTVITFSGAIGLELLYASRGGIGAQPLFLLEGNGCTWDSATAQLTLAIPAVDGEKFLILAQ